MKRCKWILTLDLLVVLTAATAAPAGSIFRKAQGRIRPLTADPTARWVEYITPSPYIEDIVTTPFELDENGLLTIPQTPGLGIELDWDAVKHYAGQS